MNKVHRIVWSHHRQAWVVTHENAAGRGKPASARRGTLAAAAAAAALFAGLGGAAQAAGPLPAAALPSGGQVTSGSAGIATTGGAGAPRLDIVQGTPRAVIDWQRFDIGASAQVHFQQPAGGATLNRVLGGDASRIFGRLTSTGQVFLVNPGGVLFAPGAQVDVGGLVASTRAIGNADFMAGRLIFEGSTDGTVVNQGRITTAAGGTVALIAAKIVNTGSITAPQGQVLMGAGNRVTLDLGGPVKIEVTEGALEALIEQGGAIRADGGLVYLSAQAAGTMASAAINQSGRIEAGTLATGKTGEIFLMADMAQGSVTLGGTLQAEGGFVETSAARVQVQEGAQVQAGHWLIDPTDITVNAAMATALQGQLASGNATVQTQAAGGGNGDIFVNAPITWTSGRTLTLQAHRNVEINATLDASGGSGGRLAVEYGLAGPIYANRASFTVATPVKLRTSGLATGINTAPTTFSTKWGSDGNTFHYTVLGSASALQAIGSSLGGSFALAADVNLQGVAWTPLGRRNAPFFGRFDGLGHTVRNLNLSSATPQQGLFGETGYGNVGNVNLRDFTVRTTVPSFTVGHAGALAGQIDGTVVHNIGLQNIRIDGSPAAGSGTAGSQTLGGLAGEANGLTRISRITARQIDVRGSSLLGGLVGFMRTYANVADARVDGVSLTITGMAGFEPSSVGGLVGYAGMNEGTDAVVRSHLRGLEITTASGAVANGAIGGLVGSAIRGRIADSYVDGRIAVNNTASNAYGGVGGLVGRALGTNISNSYSLADVRLGGSQGREAGVGGLVGYAESLGSYNVVITNAYATGKVEHGLSGTQANAVGGLVGGTKGAVVVTNGYWDVASTGRTQGVGAGTVTGTGAKGLVAGATGGGPYDTGGYAGFDFTNTWFQLSSLTRPFLRAEWSATITNAHQLQLMAMNPTARYTLANDIDLRTSLTRASEMWGRPAGATGTFQGSFHPVGDANRPFTGSLEGGGNTLANLNVDFARSGAGLFGVTSGADIRNLELAGGQVRSSAGQAGALAGQMVLGSVSNVTSTVRVEGGGSEVGGLVGVSSGSITQAFSAGAVQTVTSASHAGGLVGRNLGSISLAYATGAVSGGAQTGGLAGSNTGTVTNAYATGNVTGRNDTGGLVGLNDTRARITTTYSAGSVTNTGTGVGGLVGRNAGEVSLSYWDTTTSGRSSSAGGEGRPTAQMKNAAIFDSWGPALGVDTTVNNLYPQLRWTRSGAPAGTSAWVMGLPQPIALNFTLGTAPGSYTYNGSEVLLGGVWNAASIFGSAYGSWTLGTDYRYTYNGSPVTGFTNAGTYTGIAISVLKPGFTVAPTGNTAGSLSISPKLLTGSITGGGSVYGQALVPGSLTLSGIVGSDVVSGGAVRVDTARLTRSASGRWNAGTFAQAQTVGTALTGASAANYRFAGATASYTITPAVISAVGGIAVLPKTYDGSTVATLDTTRATFSGLLHGDQLRVAGGSGAYADANAGTGKAVAISGLTLGGSAAGNYTLAGVTGTALGDIARKTITVDGITAASKVYDGSTAATLDTATAVFQGRVGSDELVLATASGSFADANAGTAKPVDIGGLTLGGAAAGNYTLGTASTRASADITPKPVTVSGLLASDKTYDGSTSASLQTAGAALSGLVAGDAPAVVAASGAFADANAGTGKVVNVTAVTLAGTGAGNYTASATPTTGTIHRAPLQVQANEFVSSASTAPAVLGETGCVLASTCITGLSLNGASLALNFASGQLAGNYDTTLVVSNASGSLTVARPLSWNGFGLRLSAAADLHIQATLSATGANDKLTLQHGQGAVAAGNPYTLRFGLGDTGFSGRADLQPGQNYSTRQGSDGSAVDWTVVTQLGTAASSNDGTLQGIRGALSGRFVLGADIDASATAGWNGGAGWTPLGNATTRFTGRFDGLGHVVSGLHISTSSNVANNLQGLFGYAVGASLANVGLTGTRITGARFMGALLGQGDNVQIDNAHATDAILTGERGVGGLVGFLRLGSNVNDSFATGETRGNGTVDIAFHGGLVGLVEGWNAGSGNVAASIRRSFANVNVGTTAGNTGVRNGGGLVGMFRGGGVIEDSFALGSVRGRDTTGSDGVGGLVGRLGTGGDAAAGTIARSYASGAVSTLNGTGIGGLVGLVNVGSVTASLWDTQTTGRATSAGGAGAVGKTTEQLQRIDTYLDAGWNAVLADATTYAGLSDFRRAGVRLDGSGAWRINPKYIAYTLPTIGGGSYTYNGQAQTPVEWNSRSILGAPFADWVLGTDYIVTAGGQNVSSVTDAGTRSNLAITFLRGGTGHHLNASSGNTAGSLTVDPAPLVVRANDDARFVTQAENVGYAGVSYSGFVAGQTPAVLGGALTLTRSGGGSNAAGSYDLVPGGLSSGNYALNFQNGQYQILAADQLLVKAGAQLSPYGQAVAWSAPTVQYVAGGSVLTLDLAQQSGASFVFAEAGTPAHTVGFTLAPAAPANSSSGWLNAGRYGLVSSGFSASTPNYTGGAGKVVLSGQLQVLPKAVTASFDPRKTYDRSAALNPALAVAGVVAGDSFALAASGQFSSHQAGSGIGYTLTLTPSGSDAANYTVSGGRASGGSYIVSGSDGRIDRKALGLTGLSAASKVYDGSTGASFTGTAVLTGGVVAGDSLGLSGSAIGTFASRNAGTGLAVSLSGLGLQGSGASNYTLTLPAGYTASITPATINAITGITAADKVYDGGTTATLDTAGAAFTGRVAGDSLTVASASGSFADRHAGTGKAVAITALALGGADAGNYTLASTTASTTASITPASIAAVSGITAADKTYDGSTAATLDTGGAVFSGRIGNDVLTVAGASGNFGDANAGSGKAVNISALALGGADAGNYLLLDRSASTTASILAKALTVSGSSAADKVYDGGLAAAVTAGTLSGLVGSETLVLTASGSFGDKNVGDAKPVAVSYTLADGTLGGRAANYSLAGETLAARITPASATVTANSASGVYSGMAQAVAGYTVAGLVAGEDASVLSGVAASGASRTDAGTSVHTVSGPASNGNYSLSFVDGSLVVEKAPATVIADSAITTYSGLAQSVGGYTVTGLVNGETASVLTGVTAGGSGTAAGTYATTASGSAANYALSFVDGALRIDRAPVTVTGASAQATYDGRLHSVSGYTVSGLVNGESEAVLTGLSSPGASGTNAGRYANAVSGPTDNGNYTLRFVDGRLTIAQADATVTANSGSTVYNGQPQTLGGHSVSGLVNGETAAVLQGVGATGASGTDAGVYANLATGSADNGNYRLNFINGALLIDKAPATVTANGGSSTYTGRPQTVSGFSVSGLLGNDTASLLTDVRAETTVLDAGSYTTQASGSAANYRLEFVDGQFTVLRAPATVTADSGSGTYTGLMQGVTGYTVTGLLNGQDASVLTGVASGGAFGIDAGRYTHTVGGSDRNYELSFIDGNYLIRPAEAVVTANSGRATYNGQAQGVSGFSVTGLVNGEDASVLGNVSAGGGGTAAGRYATTASGHAANYTLRFVDGEFVIDRAVVAVSGLTALAKPYDGGTAAAVNTGTAAFSGRVAGDELFVASASGSFADKNVGSGKAVAISGITLGGAAAANYVLTDTAASTTADITRLASVRWVGGASGHWFDPANWAGGAVPDLANVARVEVPGTVTLSFSAAAAAAPADGRAPVQIDGFSGTSASLILADGRLQVGSPLQLAGYAQGGGQLAVAGDFTVTQAYRQTGGEVGATGNVALTQADGGLQLGLLRSGGRLDAQAPGAITQLSGSALLIDGGASFTSRTARVRLGETGNRFGSAPVIVQADAGEATIPLLAIASAQRTVQSSRAPTPSGLASGAGPVGGIARLFGPGSGLVLVETSGDAAGNGSPPAPGARDAAGFLRVFVVDGGIQLPAGLPAPRPAAPTR